MVQHAHHWLPYRWEPVHYVGREFRVTYGFAGDVEELVAIIGDQRHHFDVADGIAEVIIPAVVMDTVPDRTEARIEIKTGGQWHLMCLGHLTRR